MTLWLLTPIDEATHWKPWYEKAVGFVIRAGSELEARQFADQQMGDECRDHHDHHPWLSAAWTRCEVLTREGEVGVVMRDFRS